MKLSLERLAARLRAYLAGVIAALSARLDALEYSSGVAGVGGLAAGQVVYVDTVSGAYLPARADAVATARRIAGVVPAAAAAGASASAYGAGTRRVLAAASCVPVRGGEAYLSRVTAGAVTSVVDGLTYPRVVGYFVESAVAIDGTVAVRLAPDDARDDGRDWVLADVVLLADATAINYPVTRALWRWLRTEAGGVGAAANADVSFGANRTRVWYADGGAGSVTSYTAATKGVTVIGGAAKSSLEVEEMWSGGTVWNHVASAWSSLVAQASQNTGGREVSFGSADAPGNVIADAGAALVFKTGSRIYIRGRVRRP
jgi:hypothetical protein